MQKLIKELQNFYSWNQFYQERKMRPQMKKAQIQITLHKQKINEIKNSKKGKTTDSFRPRSGFSDVSGSSAHQVTNIPTDINAAKKTNV